MTRAASPITEVFVLAEPLRDGVPDGGGKAGVDLVPPVDLFERADRGLQLKGALVAHTLRRPVPVALLPGDPDTVALRLAEATAGEAETTAVHRHRTPVGLRYHVFVRFADAAAARAAMGGAGLLDEPNLAESRPLR